MEKTRDSKTPTRQEARLLAQAQYETARVFELNTANQPLRILERAQFLLALGFENDRAHTVWLAGRILTLAPRIKEHRAPRPSRQGEAWLRRQLATLNTEKEGN